MVSASQLSLFDSRSDAEAFAVRVSLRARRLTVRVHVDGRVEVVVPRGVGAGTVRAFVQRNRSWIDQKVAEMGQAERVQESKPASIKLAATGEEFAVVWRPGNDRSVHVEAHFLIVHCTDVRTGYELLRKWLVATARARLTPRILELAEALCCAPSGVSIRRQRTRWGSCSSRGNISLNCALLFMPPAVVRYLMIHELVHLQHMNHSAQFWERVEYHEPGYRALDRELTSGWRAVPSWVFKG